MNSGSESSPVTAAAPSVTVIIATYNWSSVLPFSIGSALRQTFTDLEVLVVGDGCTDDSEAVVGAVGDARVRWINLPQNTGHQSGPNNEGLRQARGEFIAYLGHDDLWMPHHLACLVPRLADGADLAHSVALIVGADGTSTKPAPRLVRYTAGAGLPPTCVVHRRRVTEELGGWRHYRELDEGPDRDLWRRVHDGGRRIDSVPRLTAIKFPAATRPDVYRKRPCHEQAAWTARMRTQSDLEPTELAKMLAATQAALEPVRNAGPPRLLDVVRSFVRETARWIRYKRSGPSVRPGKGAGIDARRDFKGLERRP